MSTSVDELAIPAGDVVLAGDLVLPEDARGLVVFVHGSGSSRLSPRNRFVADRLNAAALGTLLFDLLTEGEARDRANVFDIDLLTQRLVAVVSWLRGQPATAGLPIGLFGASTGAAAAICAAARTGRAVAAIVSRGGRPDLAEQSLAVVEVPTLLIVGSADAPVLALNREVRPLLGGPTRLEIIPGAGHLFEEPGALEQVSNLAANWFVDLFEGRRDHPPSLPAG
jgi:pimeloyl-ACP methyl ester carboxylesterase